MIQVTNEKIIAHLGRESELRASIEKDTTICKNLTDRIQQNQKLLETCTNVWVIIDGIALGGGHVNCVALDKTITTRFAGFYKNAHNSSTWGLHTYAPDTAPTMPSLSTERWHGAGWPSLESVQQAAIQWVVHGIVPPTHHS